MLHIIFNDNGSSLIYLNIGSEATFDQMFVEGDIDRWPIQPHGSPQRENEQRDHGNI